jgi:hypothetical protein
MVWAGHKAYAGHPFIALPAWDRRQTGFHRMTPPEAEADRVAKLLLAQPPGRRAVLLFGIGGRDVPSNFWAGDDSREGLRLILIDGPRTAIGRQWCNLFFARLAALGAVPDLIVLDNEDAVSPIGGAKTDDQKRAVFKDVWLGVPGIRDRYGGALREWDPDVWLRDGSWKGEGTTKGYRPMSFFQTHLTCDALDAAVVEPARRWFGPAVKVCDFGRTPVVVNDPNGHPVAARVVGTHSGYAAYFGPGNVARNAVEQKPGLPDVMWRQLVVGAEARRVIADVQAIAAAGPAAVWVAPHTWFDAGREDFAAPAMRIAGTEALLDAIYAGGVEYVLLFNTTQGKQRALDAALWRQAVERRAAR